MLQGFDGSKMSTIAQKLPYLYFANDIAKISGRLYDG